jgi:hypothetical protein
LDRLAVARLAVARLAVERFAVERFVLDRFDVFRAAEDFAVAFLAVDRLLDRLMDRFPPFACFADLLFPAMVASGVGGSAYRSCRIVSFKVVFSRAGAIRRRHRAGVMHTASPVAVGARGGRGARKSFVHVKMITESPLSDRQIAWSGGTPYFPGRGEDDGA